MAELTVEKYLEQHNLEFNLNEILNQCMRGQPDDPFLFVSNMLRSKSATLTGIICVNGREVLSSSGDPTLEAEVTTSMGCFRCLFFLYSPILYSIFE